MTPLRALALLLVAAAAPHPVGAQTVGLSTGAIVGTVTDRTGALLPGVEVRVTGDSLMGSRTATTGGEGRYRVAGLPPGRYTVVFARQQFVTVTRTDIVLSPAFTATVDEVLHVSASHDHVVVEGRAPAVDRQSTAIRYTFGPVELANLPNSRSVFALLTATPSVHVARIEVGGASGAAGAPYSAYGTSGSNRPLLEGINISGMFPAGLSLDYGSFSEVTVGTGAPTAEWSAPGVHMQFISKSGGNQYRGSAYADYENRHWQATNIDTDQINPAARASGWVPAREANRLWSYHDLNADIGGYIKPDAVWWYLSFREQDVSARQVNFPVKPVRTRLTNYTGKATYRATPGNTLVAYAQGNRNYQPTRLDPFNPRGGSLTVSTAINESENSTTEQVAWNWVWKGEWNAVISDDLYFETRAGGFRSDRPETPNGRGPRFEDVGSQRVSGGHRHFQQNQRRYQWTTSLSWFEDGWHGSHHVKLGAELIRWVTTDAWLQGFAGDVLHVLRNGAPTEVYLFQTPSKSENGLAIYSGHLSDSWRVTDRLTITPGLRFDRFRSFLPAQSVSVGRFNPSPQTFAPVDEVVVWNVAAPRVGMALDLAGTGRAVVKANYAYYGLAPGTELAATANPNPSAWWSLHAWSDANASGVWDPGEEGPSLARSGAASPESVDPRIRPMQVHEIGTSIEHERSGGLGLRTGLVWREQSRPFVRQTVNRPFEAFSVPTPLADPGPDGRIGTPDDGPAIMAFGLSPDLLDDPPQSVVRTVQGAADTSLTWDVVATRRFSRRWSLVAGFSHTWTREHANAYAGQVVRQNAYPLTPNDLINTRPDGTHEYRSWTAKVFGTYDAPWDVRITPILRHQAGQPFGRTFVATLNYGTIRILAEPIGTRRMDSVTLVDVRLEKGFRLSPGRRIAGFVDVFNLLNANPEQNMSWLSGDTFLRPLNIVAPRIARAGIKLDW